MQHPWTSRKLGFYTFVTCFNCVMLIEFLGIRNATNLMVTRWFYLLQSWLKGHSWIKVTICSVLRIMNNAKWSMHISDFQAYSLLNTKPKLMPVQVTHYDPCKLAFEFASHVAEHTNSCTHHSSSILRGKIWSWFDLRFSTAPSLPINGRANRTSTILLDASNTSY